MNMRMRPSWSFFQTTSRSPYQILRSCLLWSVSWCCRRSVCFHAWRWEGVLMATYFSLNIILCASFCHIFFREPLNAYLLDLSYSFNFHLLAVCAKVACQSCVFSFQSTMSFYREEDLLLHVMFDFILCMSYLIL